MNKKLVGIGLVLTVISAALLGSPESAAAQQRRTYRQGNRSGYVQQQRSRRTQQSRAKARTTQRNASQRTRSAGGNTGLASWYGGGGTTASGQAYNQNGNTAAHPSLPFGTVVNVTNLRTGKSTSVVINDRGPFVGGRIIDLSRGAANRIGMTGVDQVRISY